MPGSLNHSQPDFDAGIVGGGPAGAAMAAYLATAGVRVVVFERSLFPRPHVGESLVPSATRVFKELGFLDIMERERFPKKYGAVWTTAASKQYGVLDFDGVDPDCQPPRPIDERNQWAGSRPYSYHVDRAKFDLLLLQHAHRLGAAVYEGIAVTAVDFDSGPYPLIRYAIGRQEHATSVHVVIDASGRQTLLGNQLRIKMVDPMFDQYAIHTWFEGFARHAFARSEALANHIFIHFLPISDAWVWQIPITDTITSIGVVAQKIHAWRPRAPGEALFWKLVESRPEVAEHLRAAQRLRPFTEEGDCSYAMKRTSGDRYVLIGDAARFVDPIFATGVSVALNSARLAHRDVLAALETGDFGPEAFATYDTTVQRGGQNWSAFMSLYYRLSFLFTQFLSNPVHRSDILRLLQGDVYDEDPPAVMAEMRQAVLEVQRNPAHPWHRLLHDPTDTVFQPLF